MGRPRKSVELPTCTCSQHTCKIHGANRPRTFRLVNRWFLDGKVSREDYDAWLAEHKPPRKNWGYAGN